jgi:hypothetical protein
MRIASLVCSLLIASPMSVALASSWDDHLDPVGVTTPAIANGQRPVLRVLHEEGPGGWQFYDGGNLVGVSPVVLPKTEFLRLDPSLRTIKDLPVGWEATRKSKSDPWVRRQVQP